MTAAAPAKPKRRWGRWAIALLILNEIRGIMVVAPIVTAWWQGN